MLKFVFLKQVRVTIIDYEFGPVKLQISTVVNARHGPFWYNRIWINFQAHGYLKHKVTIFDIDPFSTKP